MQALISNLVAAVLLVHAVLGCCWQHAHRATADQGTAICQVASCCDHCDGNPSTEEPAVPCDCESKCHGFCVYLAEKSSDSLGNPAMLHLLAALPVEPLPAAIGFDSCLWIDGLVDSGPPAVRLHLRHQILLI